MYKIFFICLIFIYSSLSANEKVVLQLKWLHQFQFAGYYMALEKGFYKDAGLDVTIKQRDLKKDNIQQVIDGEAQYGIADSVLFLYKAKHEPIIIVAPIFQHSPNVILTLKSSGLDSPYKLNNKDLTFYKNDADGFAILAMFKNLDVIPHLSRTKSFTDYTSLIDHKTDAYTAYITNEPFYFKQAGIKINIIYPANYGVDLYGDMLFTSLSEATKHPQRVEKFKEATLKGWEYALKHKEETIQLIHKKYAIKKSLEHLRYEADGIEQLITEKYIPLGTVDPGRIQYIISLYSKYNLIQNNIPIDEFIFDPTNTHDESKLVLTNDEKNYLKNKKIIKMCVDPDWMPLEGIENGIHTGLAADYVKILEKTVETPIQLVPTKSWSQSLEYGKERKCDIFSLMAPTKERSNYFNFTRPYLKLPVFIVTNNNQFYIEDLQNYKDKKIGIVRGYAFKDILKERYPDINLQEVDNIDEGLQQVADGKLFAFVDTMATVGYLIQKKYVGQLKIAGKIEKAWALGIGCRNDEPILRNIFDKALNTISLKQQQDIYNKWIYVRYDNSKDMRNFVKWAIIVFTVLGVVLIFILYVNRRLNIEISSRKSAEKKLLQLSITDGLTQLYNRRYFDEVFAKYLNSAKRMDEFISFAILDVDNFKKYNDTYGHAKGDEALIMVAKILNGHMNRSDDYAFRLGGEEFGLLFKGKTLQDSLIWTEKIRKAVEELQIEHSDNANYCVVTVSIGIVTKKANSMENFEKLYKEADELMYLAKENGRNKVVSNEI